ncbi:hypothetical protein pb186bvf_009083 [Paramecium bursaria]
MGACQSESQKPKHYKSQSMTFTNQESKVNDTTPLYSIKETLTTQAQNYSQDIYVNNHSPYKSYTLIPKESKICQYGKIFHLQHNLSGQVRIDVIIEDQNEEGMQIFKKIQENQLEHFNIAKVFEIYKYQHQYHILFEYCAGGTLEDFLRNKQSLSEVQIARIFQQMLLAIQYLHQRKIYHGKLTLGSFSFLNESDDLVIKFTDFYNLHNILEMELSQTLYLSPESACDIEQTKTASNDFWALGIMLYRMLSDNFPYKQQQNFGRAILQVKKGAIPFDIMGFEKRSPKAMNLVQCMLRENIKQRYTLQQCLMDSWLTISEHYILNVHLALDNMQVKQKKPNALQLKILIFMIKHFGTHEQQKFFEIFHQFDVNKDGKLSKQELKAIYLKLYPDLDANQQVQKVFEFSDLDKSGDIDVNEFMAATIDKTYLLNKQNVEMTFKLLDLDKGGTITHKEFSRNLGIDQALVSDIMQRYYKKLAIAKNEKYKCINHFSYEDFKIFMLQLL